MYGYLYVKWMISLPPRVNWSADSERRGVKGVADSEVSKTYKNSVWSWVHEICAVSSTNRRASRCDQHGGCPNNWIMFSLMSRSLWTRPHMIPADENTFSGLNSISARMKIVWKFKYSQVSTWTSGRFSPQQFRDRHHQYPSLVCMKSWLNIITIDRYELKVQITSYRTAQGTARARPSASLWGRLGTGNHRLKLIFSFLFFFLSEAQKVSSHDNRLWARIFVYSRGSPVIKSADGSENVYGAGWWRTCGGWVTVGLQLLIGRTAVSDIPHDFTPRMPSFLQKGCVFLQRCGCFADDCLSMRKGTRQAKPLFIWRWTWNISDQLAC